jgi:hypothetical protein
MILSGTTPRRLSWGGGLVLGLGLMLLPLVPGWAQERPGDARKDERSEDRKPDSTPDARQLNRARVEVEKLRDELAEQVKKMHAAEEKLRQAAQRLHELEGKGGDIRIIILRGSEQPGTMPGRIRLEERWVPRELDARPKTPAPVDPRLVPPDQGGESRRLQELERRLEQLMREMGDLRRQLRLEQGGDPKAAPRKELPRDPAPALPRKELPRDDPSPAPRR